MTLADDGLPTSELARLDAEIQARIRALPQGPIDEQDLAVIRELKRQRMEMTRPKSLDDALALLDSIAAPR